MISQKLTLTPVKGLTFNDEDGKHQHLYCGAEWPGCTSVSGLYSLDGWKFAWPVKLMEQKMVEQAEKDQIGFPQGDSIFNVEYIKQSAKKHKNAWREKRDKSADTGTLAHKYIETYIKDGTWPPTDSGAEVFNCFNEFLKWTEKYSPKWLASEIQVGSLTHSFAGILDSLAEIDGKTVLIDFKTSSGIKPDYNIQLAGLCICLEEMGLTVDQRAILHLPKKGEFEFKIIDTDLEFEKECFISGLFHYRYKNMFLGKNEYKK